MYATQKNNIAFKIKKHLDIEAQFLNDKFSRLFFSDQKSENENELSGRKKNEIKNVLQMFYSSIYISQSMHSIDNEKNKKQRIKTVSTL